MFDLTASVRDSFVSKVDAVLAQQLCSFRRQEDIYNCLPGLFPGEVAERLRRSITTGCQHSKVVLSMLEDGDPTKKVQVRTDLVLPHPLDFEWLFTDETANELTGQLVDSSVGTVACVGTPSIYQALGRVNPNVRRILADRPGVADKLRDQDHSASVFHFSELPNVSLEADVAVVDSPWYPAHAVHFIEVAASLTRLGGRIFAVVPPEFTRPGVPLENEAIIESVARRGIGYVNLHRGVVTYQAPPFEVSTLKALSLYGVSHRWRRGDLLELSVERPISASDINAPSSEVPWDELRFQSSRIKFRADVLTDEVDPSLRSIVSGDVLTSVSRRDPARSRVGVWTSGNRGFECTSPNVLRVGFEAFMEERDPVEACQDRLSVTLPRHMVIRLNQAVEQLVACVQLEEAELEWR